MKIYEFVIRNSAQCPVELYRGLKNFDVESIEVGKRYKFEHDVESFTEDIDIALEFAKNLNDEPAVLIRIDEPVGLPVYAYTGNENEQEWLISDGHYVIENIGVDEDYNCIFIGIKEEIK